MASEDQLPPVFKERIFTRAPAITNSSFLSQASTTRTESSKYLKCTLIEYFMLYFAYYATLPTVGETSFGAIRKAVSLVSLSMGGLAGSMTL